MWQLRNHPVKSLSTLDSQKKIWRCCLLLEQRQLKKGLFHGTNLLALSGTYSRRNLSWIQCYEKDIRTTILSTILEPKKTRNPKIVGLFFLRLYVTSCQKKHNTQSPSKMAESLPYGIAPHGFYWPLLGQKSSHKKSN
jgi:hypothetical protein